MTFQTSTRLVKKKAPLLRRRTMNRVAGILAVTGIGVLVMLVFLMPLGYMLATAFKQDSQLSAQNAPLWPADAATYSYQDRKSVV